MSRRGSVRCRSVTASDKGFGICLGPVQIKTLRIICAFMINSLATMPAGKISTAANCKKSGFRNRNIVQFLGRAPRRNPVGQVRCQSPVMKKALAPGSIKA